MLRAAKEADLGQAQERQAAELVALKVCMCVAVCGGGGEGGTKGTHDLGTLKGEGNGVASSADLEGGGTH